MPYALVTLGLIMIVTGVNNTYAAFAAQLRSDFTGQRSFIPWILAIGSVGALGYVQALRSFSHYFMALIIIALVLAHQGFLAKFQEALNLGPLAPPANPAGANDANGVSSPLSTQSGALGQAPTNPGQAKFNGWMNYFSGGGWMK